MAFVAAHPIIASAVIGAASSFLGGRGQRRAAERQAEALSRPRTFSQTTTSGFDLDAGIQSSLMDLLGSFQSQAFSGVPQFPDFQGFNFSPTQLQGGFQSFDYTPLDTPDIAGASQDSRDILAKILGLTETSPFLDPVAENFDDILSGDANQFFELAEAFLGGDLGEIGAGAGLSGANPFEDSVVDALRRDSEETLGRDLASISAEASGLRRVGGRFEGELQSRARQRSAQDFEDRAATVRAGNFENERSRQLSALGTSANLVNSLVNTRSGDIRSVLAAAPQLENARFTGVGLAGDVSANIDARDQAAAIFMAQFAQTEHGRDANADLAAAQQAMQRFFFENEFRGNQNIAGTGFAAQLANMQNLFGQNKATFDLTSPYFGLNQLGNFLLPLAELTGNRTSTTTGQNQQFFAPGYTPSPWESLFSGGLGGFLLGKGFQNSGLFGGLNSSQQSVLDRLRREGNSRLV